MPMPEKKTLNVTPETHSWLLDVKHKMEKDEQRALSFNRVINRLIIFFNTDGGRSI